jgi:NAD(P)H-hydrate epimerase
MTEEAAMTDGELAALLVETGHRHHQAYLEADGVDPEWASWYAGYLQAHLWDRLGALLSRSEITYLLIRGDREVRESDDPSQWPSIYAGLLREAASR